MQVKAFELRDRGTFVPAVAILMSPANPEEWYLLRRAGFPSDPGIEQPMILLGSMEDRKFYYDPYEHPTSTFLTALPYIQKNWDKLKSGDVICTEFIRGERTEPKKSERLLDDR